MGRNLRSAAATARSCRILLCAYCDQVGRGSCKEGRLPEKQEKAGASGAGSRGLYHCYGFGLQTLRAILDRKLNPSALVERPVARRLDRRVVHKNVFPIRTLDKAKALSSVKPLHSSCFFHLQTSFSE